MLRSGTTEREIWLQLICLVVSVGLHAVLTAMLWSGGSVSPDGDEPIIVSLVARPAGKSAGAPPPAVIPRPKSQPAAPARRQRAVSPPVSTKPPVVEAQPVKPRPVVPEKTADDVVVELAPPLAVEVPVLPDGGGVGDAVSAGTDSGSGTANGSGGRGKGRGREGGGDDGMAGLIKATPRYESNPLPPYPRVARQNHWEGTVRLRARVTAAGDIEQVALERGSGHEVLDHAALQGVRQWRFIPATRNGVPVACEVSIPVAFRLTE